MCSYSIPRTKRCYRRALSLDADQSNLTAKHVEVNTVDGMQSRGKSTIIFDLTITTRPGFVKPVNRMVTALSRAKNRLYIILNGKESNVSIQFSSGPEKFLEAPRYSQSTS